jgi:hypothetical protein
MSIQPPHQSDAQVDVDEYLKNPLAASDIDIDILNDLSICEISIQFLGLDTFGSLLGNYDDSVYLIVKEFEDR